MFYASCRGLQIFFSVQSLKTSEAEIIVVKNNRENCHTIRVESNRNKGELDNRSLIKKTKTNCNNLANQLHSKAFFLLAKSVQGPPICILPFFFKRDKCYPKNSSYLTVLFAKSLTETPINFLKFLENVNLELNKHFSPKDSTV